MISCGCPLRFAKYLFIILLASSALVLLKIALQFQNEEKKTTDFILYNPRFSGDNTWQMLRSDFNSCIAQPSKSVCIETRDNKLQVFYGYRPSSSPKTDEDFPTDNFIESHNKSSKGKGTRIRLHPVHAAFVEFTRFCKALNIQPVLIEPSVLFCMLSQDNQNLLLKRRFNISSLMGNENVLTVTINENDSLKLSDPKLMKELLLTDFSYWSTEMEKTDDTGDVSSNGRNLKTHHFFNRQRIVIHVVVFYQRSNYFWHGGIDVLPTEILEFTPLEDLLFSKAEAIYERFEPVEVPAEPVMEALHIPSDPRLFLHQIKDSKFLHCNSTNAAAYYSKYNRTVFKTYGYAKHEEFIRKAMIIIQDMKFHLHSELMKVWIMGGTLLGWYRECGLIPYTTDIDFAAWAADIQDDPETFKKLVKHFQKHNQRLVIIESLGLPREAQELKFHYQNLKVDLFFAYDDGEHYWVSGHRESRGYYFPYYYPKFTLCSGDLLGHKIQLPCETLEVLLADYGPKWETPVEEWNYESSPKNMGKRRYWYKEERPLAHAIF